METTAEELAESEDIVTDDVKQKFSPRHVSLGVYLNKQHRPSIMPGSNLEAYNQNFKSRFVKMLQKLSQHSQSVKEEISGNSFNSVDDVDFVFVANKTQSTGVWLKLANWIARIRRRPPITLDNIAEARKAYVAGLKEKYNINCQVIETPEREYYLIQLSFYHLGLMMELVGYQWQLRTFDPEKKAYKTFFFSKRKIERFHEYQLGRSRTAFPARWRYDLTHFFLMGANVRMPYYNPWRNALKEPLQDQIAKMERMGDAFDSMEEGDAMTKKEKGYSLMRLFADNIFDDWMVLHNEIRTPSKTEIVSRIKEVSKSENCCNAGCAGCFFPTITCQCAEVKSETIGNSFPDRRGCSSFGISLCSIWRSFWYNNLIDSAHLNIRTLEDGTTENTREYLGRIGTPRNAFRLRSIPDSGDDAAKMRHILPLNRLNDYFGEKIGLYFAWIELLLISLIIPALIGVVMFVCGVIYYSYQVIYSDEANGVDDPIGYILAKACDNYATPGFAAIMIVWGTAFYEVWNRRQQWLAFLWRVENLEKTELERPPVYSLKFAAYVRKSAIGAPFMYLPSVFTTLFFIFLVFASVYFINVMNIFSITYCPKPLQMLNATMSRNGTKIVDGNSLVDRLICNLFSAAQVLANSLSMMVLDGIFTRICYHLTDFEGHLTQSEYTDSLILKLFAFRFFNYYSVLFYIAFGIATKSVQYPAEITGGKTYDYESYGCGEQPCMSLLSRQLLSVIVTQPFLNSIIDITMPLLKLIYYSVKDAKRTSSRKINPGSNEQPNEHTSPKLTAEIDSQYRMMELSSLDRKEFTAEEYTDKLIVYGALVMFSVALPPAPALAFLIMRIDLNLDLGRIMTKFRRPLPQRAQDIGMWAHIMNFLTYAGIITNPLIVVLTSSWGSRFDVWWKFVIFLVVEHVVFAVRMLVVFIVPDVPKSLTKQQQIHKLMKDEVQDGLIREMTQIAVLGTRQRNRKNDTHKP